MIREASQVRFNTAIKHRLSGQKYEIFHTKDLQEINLSQYDKLIISGSEACAGENNPWDRDLSNITMYYIENNKPVLGICYGHQFLAALLIGKDIVIKSKTPEFGIANIDLECSNPLFDGIDSLTSCTLHFDEVVTSSKDIKIIASGPRCANYAFQYKDLPVWGVQFHPEYTKPEIDSYLEDIKVNRPETSKHFIFDPFTDNSLLNTKIIFNNFFGL
jgi:GMP synthase (glutamine-hydrolysing)